MLKLSAAKNELYRKQRVVGRLGDGDLTTIDIILLQEDGSSPYILTSDMKLMFKGNLANGEYTEGPIIIQGFQEGFCQYTFSKENFSAAREYKRAYIELVDASGAVTTFQDFIVDVLPDADLSRGQVQLYVSKLDTLLKEFSETYSQFVSEKDSEFQEFLNEKEIQYQKIYEQYNDLVRRLNESDQRMKSIENDQARIIQLIEDNDVFTKSESSANVIDQIGGAESAVLKKELLVNGVEGTGSRYVKDLPYKENILMKSGRFLDYGVATNEGWKATLLDNGNLQITVPTQTAQHFRIPLHGIKSLKKNDTLSLAVRAKADHAITLPFGVTKEYTALSWAGGKINLSSAMDTIKTSGKIGIDGEINYLYMTSTSFDASLAGTKIEIEFLKLVENDEVDDTWCPSAEDVGIVHGQPNLADGTSNEWSNELLTGDVWGYSIYSIAASNNTFAVGDTCTVALDLNVVSADVASKRYGISISFRNSSQSEISYKTTYRFVDVGETDRIITNSFTVPENTASIRVQVAAESSTTSNAVVRYRRLKFIKGTEPAMDEWTPSQTDSGLTPVNNGMVPFTDDDYGKMISDDGIVRAETSMVGRGSEIEVIFDVIGTLEKSYPFLFEGLTTLPTKIAKYRSLVKKVSSTAVYRGRGIVNGTLGYYGRTAIVTASGSTAWGINPVNKTSEFVENTSVLNSTHMAQLYPEGYFKFLAESSTNIASEKGAVSDGVTPAWIELKDFRLTIELEVNGRTIIEEMIAANHVENIATQEEAEAGEDNTKIMTPKRVIQSVAEWIKGRFVSSSGDESINGVKNFISNPLIDNKKVITEYGEMKRFVYTAIGADASLLNATQKAQFSDMRMILIREGSQVYCYARINPKVAKEMGNTSYQMFAIPTGYKKATIFSTHIWNIPFAIDQFTTPQGDYLAFYESDTFRFYSDRAGNHYISGTWFTDDPFPTS